MKHGRYGLQTYLANTDMDHISAVVLMMQLIQKTQLLSPLGLPSYVSSSSSSIKTFMGVHKQRRLKIGNFGHPCLFLYVVMLEPLTKSPLLLNVARMPPIMATFDTANGYNGINSYDLSTVLASIIKSFTFCINSNICVALV